ncbi:DUF2199 domain-containing protein [Streptomyces sp. NPDC060028]|uniref:DUF2199 domain-containing protein n=1 Tax=Streptomyces sp. NPDC060028 TaxID=3347041 RepID=UPI00367D4249
MLSSDQCVIKGQHFFVRGLIEIPVSGSEDVFSWGVWVSLSRDNFSRALEMWNTESREAEEPYFGWLSTELALYSESTINLKTHAHTRPVGKRPSSSWSPPTTRSPSNSAPGSRRTACVSSPWLCCIRPESPQVKAWRGRAAAEAF